MMDTESEKQPTQNVRILLVEDNEINRRLAVLMMEKLGCKPDCAANGAQAVEMSARSPYDLIIMDCQMPVMDGLEATRQIRQREAACGGHKARIVAMTAHAMPKDRDDCIASGMDDYITKPISLHAVKKVVEDAKSLLASAVASVSPELASEQEKINERFNELLTEFGPEPTRDLLESFLAETPGSIAALSRKSQEPDTLAFARAAHTVAGSCSVFGLERMRQLGLELQGFAEKQESNRYTPGIAAIEQEFKTVLPYLEARLKQLRAEAK